MADHSSGEWIDAEQAIYIRKNNSPMGFDLGAQAESDTDGLSYAEAMQHIEQVENKFNVHGMHHHMQHDLKQQGIDRESVEK